MSDRTYIKPKIRQHLKVMKNNHPTLYTAWQLFARFDKNANRLKVWIRFLRTVALCLGILAPLLVIFDLKWGDQTDIFQQLIIVLPILLSALLVYSNRLARGGKWLILRAAAERIKREIYSFRVGVGGYADPYTKDELLAIRLEELYRRLMETTVNSIGLVPYDELKLDLPPDIAYFSEGDDGVSPISTEEYVHYRIESQIKFYQGRVNYFHKSMQVLNFLILLAGGLGTYLAAIGLEVWIVVTTAAVSAFTGYMEYNQMENTLTSYNQALANLESIKIWWEAQDKDKQEIPEIREKLVTKAEDILNAEMLRWIQAVESVLESEDEISGREEALKHRPHGEHVVITDGTFTGPTDGPDFAGAAGPEDYDRPRDISPSELAAMSPELEEKFPLEGEGPEDVAEESPEAEQEGENDAPLASEDVDEEEKGE